MKNKKIAMTVGVVALMAVVTSGFAVSAFAYQGNPTVQGPNYTAERHEAMEAAFEAGDYAAWKELMNGKGRVTQVINEGNFAKFAEAHKLAESGDLAGSKVIRTELGLNQGGQGQGKGQGKGMNRSGAKGQGLNGSYVDANGDGSCDNVQ